MATSNVEYYERQKELQDTLHQTEEERRVLDQQLKAYFQSDQRIEKLKAVKLHSYWKKICDQEKRSKARNEQIIRNFERTDAHIASLGARTEKLKFLKQQYEEEIERKYPHWQEIATKKHDGETQVQVEAKPELQYEEEIEQKYPHWQEIATKKQDGETQVQVEAKHEKMDEHDEPDFTNVKRNISSHSVSRSKSAISNVSTTSKPDIFNVRATTSKKQVSSTTVLQETHVVNTLTSKQSMESREQTKLTEVMPVQNTSMQKVLLQNEASLPVTKETQFGVKKTYVGEKEAQQVEASNKQAGTKEMQQVGSKEMQQAVVKEIPSKSDMEGPMQPPDDDKLSDFGSDIDLPLSDALPPREESVQQFSRASSLQSSRKASEFGDLKPELTLDGLLYILKFVQDDFNTAFTLDGFYRSSRPDSKQKMKIIRIANHREDLNRIDVDHISMVALDEMTLVIRNLSEGCLLPDSLLEMNTTTQTAESIKSQLSPDAQKLWTGLFEHFDQIIKYKVMEPKEIACIFVPCLVEDGSPNQDKAVLLLVRLLTGSDTDVTDDASSVASPRVSHTPRVAVAAATASYTDEGKVPPLKFGSLIDSQRTITDEDSSMFNNSLTKDKVPLNETDAYKNMLSGSIPQNRVHNDDDTDDDDDIEKQFNSAISPREKESSKPELNSASLYPVPKSAGIRPPGKEDDDDSSLSPPSAAPSPVYVPTAMGGFRSTMTSTGSSHTPRRPVAIKISSDLDSDTELDVLAVTKNRIASESDDFDFYG